MLIRIYAWSVSIELLLFFNTVLGGVTSNISRYLQAAVLVGLAAGWVVTTRTGRISIGYLRGALFRPYWMYFLIAVVAGIVGAASGAYHVGVELASDLGIYRTVIGPSLRPMLEYLLALYYFIYFAALPQYLLRSERDVAYYLGVLRFTFVVSLVVGFVDLATTAIGRPLVPVSLAEDTFVGLRFHGLAGEPRDAFVYLFFGLALLRLRAFHSGRELGRWWVPTIVFAALMTQSASGIIGILLFLLLYAGYSVRSMSASRILRLGALLGVVVVLLAFVLKSSERIQLYMEAGSTIWNVLESRREIPHMMAVQLVNIYPLYDMVEKARQLNVIPLLIGSGLGSSSALNSNLFGSFRILNPHSQLVRTVYETGLVGTFFFITAFTSPVRKLTRHLGAMERRDFMLAALLVLGCSLAHRSAAIYVFLGAFIAVFRSLSPETQESTFSRVQSER